MSDYTEQKDKKHDAFAEKMDAKKQDSEHAHKIVREEKQDSMQNQLRAGGQQTGAESQGSTASQAIGMDRDNSVGAVTVQSALTIYSAPGTTSVSIGALRASDRVRFYGEKDGFLEVHVGGQTGYIRADQTDYAEFAAGEKKRDLERRRRPVRKYTGTRTKCDNPVYAGFVACLDALGIANPSKESFDTYLELLRRKQRLRGGAMRRFGALANALGVNYRVLLECGDETWKDRDFWLRTVREALEEGDAVLAEVDGVAMRVVEVTDDGVLFEGGRDEQKLVSFAKLDDIDWVIALS